MAFNSIWRPRPAGWCTNSTHDAIPITNLLEIAKLDKAITRKALLGQGQIQHANQSSKGVKVGIWGKVEFYVRGGDREDCWPRNRSILHFITQLKYTVSDNRIIIFKWYNYVPEPWQQLMLKMISDQPNSHILFDLLNFTLMMATNSR